MFEWVLVVDLQQCDCIAGVAAPFSCIYTFSRDKQDVRTLACLQFRNASPEDVNRSSLGRMVGGVALLWLASYAIGIPFKYGLAGALLAISAVLFAEWDQGNRARRHRSTVSHCYLSVQVCQ